MAGCVMSKGADRNYFNHDQTCGFTFASNLFQGTPTFVLFNKSMDILMRWFGHVDSQAIEEKLNTYLQLSKNE